MASPEESDMEEEVMDLDLLDQHDIVTVQSEQENSRQRDNQQNAPIIVPAFIPGTLGQETLQLRSEEAKKVFVKTPTFKNAQRILDQYHHVTICGASGEGKTTMSLMLARNYMKKGYQTVFVENIDKFDFSKCISSAKRMVLILDDIFGTVGLSTNTLHLRNVLESVKTHIQNSKEHFIKTTSLGKKVPDKTRIPEKQQPDKDIRVMFTSKTYNFQEGISHLKYQSFSLFPGSTVLDITTNKELSYSNEAKVTIFERHKTLNPSVSIQDVTKDYLLGLDGTLFGFPQTCKLFFEFSTFRSNAKDFFKHPLFYLRMELSRIMDLDNNQTAALILMLLCEDKLDLTQLELQGRDKTMDDRFKLVTNIVPSATRSGIATAARRFRGTFLTGGDTLQFAHSSIFDACACAMYGKNPTFVLKYCSYEFLYERLKSGIADETGASEHLHFIFVSKNYHDLIAARLADEIQRGHFSKTITQPILKNDHVAQLLLQNLEAQKMKMQEKNESWVHMKDKEKCFLYWAVAGYNSKLILEMEEMLNITFKQAEIHEALNGCAENNNLRVLQFLLLKLRSRSESLIKSRLLLLSAENDSWDVTEYLITGCSNFTLTNKNKQNVFHLICEKGKYCILKTMLEDQTKQNLQSAINSLDEDGRTPIMLAVMKGSLECFQLLRKKTDCTVKDKYDYHVIHLACAGGNTEIIRHFLTSSNINSRGRYGRSPIMVAAVVGHQGVFDLLVSRNADLTLVDNYGDSLLHLACQGGIIEVVRHLLTSSNINRRGQNGWTPIMVATVAGQQEVFDLLASHNADLTLMDDNEDSLLHLACRGGNTEIVRHLLTSSNVNSRGRDGYTPIMKAVCAGHQEVFDLLVSRNADLTLVSDYGDSVLHIACFGGNTQIVRRLLPSPDINSRTVDGLSPIMAAVYGGHIHIIDLLVKNQADLKLLTNTRWDLVSQHDGVRPDVAEYLKTLLKNHDY